MKALFLLPLFVGAIITASINQTSLSPIQGEERITLSQIRRHFQNNAYIYTKTVKNGALYVTAACSVYNYLSSEVSDGKNGLCVAFAVIAAGAIFFEEYQTG